MKEIVETTVSAPTKSCELFVLSALWFGLCTSLVIKHYDLLPVFLSFCFSTVASIGISSWKNRNNGNSSDAFKLSNQQRSIDQLNTRALVGIFACLTSLAVVVLGENGSFYFGGLFSLIHPEYHSLCILTGYSAFGLWYDQIYSCRQSSFPTRFVSALGDALVVSLFSVILTKWWEWNIEAWVPRPMRSLSMGWSLYKLLGFSTTVLNDGKAKPTLNSAYKSNKGRTLTKPISPELLWTIHGQNYDLSEFVSRHPGGKEAILLGRGRDCTALFESYHPFTKQHR